MLIEISNPVFKCAEDEQIFCSRLASLPGFIGLVCNLPNYRLTLDGELSGQRAEALEQICNVWGLSFRLAQESRSP